MAPGTDTALVLAATAALGIGAQWLSWRLRLPAILFLLLIGLLAGPVTGVLDPDRLFGDLLFPLVSLAVAVILFEGALTLRVQEIRGHSRVVRNLVTVGALVNGVVIAAATTWLVDLPADLALVFGAIVTVTGPTVIVPMLRTVRPRATVSKILRWEGILIDPLGALLAVVVFGFVVSGREGRALMLFLQTTAIGATLGVAAGYTLATLLRGQWLPAYLKNVTTLALVLTTFAASNALAHDSGLLAVTAMGMLLANLRDLNLEDILHFKESLTVLLVSVLFIVLAARVEVTQLQELGTGAAGVVLVVMFVARPLSVWLSTVGSSLSTGERVLIAWIGPRGIVAAAVSALFALRLESLGYPQAPLLVTLTFLVIIVTVVAQSATARALAMWLGVAEPEPRGVLIVGTNPVGLALGQALAEQGFRVLLAGLAWDRIRQGRMAGLETYYGNPVSEHADRHLDLVGIGWLLAMATRPGLNSLACLRYRRELGEGNVLTLRMAEERDESDKRVLAQALRCPHLFGEDVTFAKLASLLDQGHLIRATGLSASFGFEDYVQHYQGAAIPLFALDPKQRLHVFTAERPLRPGPGWTLLALLPPQPDAVAGASESAAGGG